LVFTNNNVAAWAELCVKLNIMKKINSNQLLESLQQDVRHIILQVSPLQQLQNTQLQQVPEPGKWSVAQVLEHLNIYSRYYIASIEKKLHLSQTGPNKNFTPGWLGNYFTRLMQPKEGVIVKKMKAPKNAIPSPQPDGIKMLEEFIAHQHHLLNLLQIAKNANLDYIRIPISLTKLITLKLGDTFRFVVAHEQRHFIQIKNAANFISVKNIKQKNIFKNFTAADTIKFIL
jgi:DinB superfamily